MNIRFLLGPAGSGKTWQCVAEIRKELLARPAGPPLILLAPRQATFQLERQLLADGALAGYTRLAIFSFSRLANYLLQVSGAGKARLLAEEGRVMVLRALLHQHTGQLRIFHASARLPGFARELSRWLRELQQQQITPQHLERAAAALKPQPELAAKLSDTALLYRAFEQWLQDHALADADGLLPLAAARLRQAAKVGQPLHLAGLWMDGFAELTPQEVDFLAALAWHCQQMTLAFCVDNQSAEELPALHPAAGVARTVRRCAAVLSELPGADLKYENLPRHASRSRFAGAPALAHLEHHWGDLAPPAYPAATEEVRLVACATPEAEVTFAAREILRHVQSGGRFREVAVLVRRLETHAALVKRIFRQYQIPFFLDQRESMAHHPLAELTRYALRVVARGWQKSDWLGALKTGLAPISLDVLDELENVALELGLEGERWLRSWSEEQNAAARWEPWRAKLVQPFLQLRDALSRHPAGVTGGTIAQSLRQFYDTLNVAETLQGWAESAVTEDEDLPPAAHATVWQAVEEWLDTLEQALNDHALPLAEWLPILESGLGQLSVGIIPPAMDQVLVGAVDRSRQPELRTLIVLGMNENLFPAPPVLPVLLSEDERARLERDCELKLGLGALAQLGAERYLGYIACTRPASRLWVTRAESQADGKPMNPSLFYLRLQQMFPQVKEENFSGRVSPAESVHVSELLPALVAAPELPPELLELVPPQVRQLRGYAQDDQLSPEAVEKLIGPHLRTSISALETYAACPFRYFVERLLHADERREFAADDLRCGSFMHEVLARFHLAVTAQGRRWRDLTPEEARALLQQVADEVAAAFHYGVMRANPRHQFRLELLVQRLEEYVAQAVQWMAHYHLEPCLVEMGFGLSQGEGESGPPAWRVPLDNGRELHLSGRMDRLDVCQPEEGNGPALAVVVDYKSREKKLEALELAHGLELQLMAYLNVVRSLPDLVQSVQVATLQPVGAFYVSLTAAAQKAENRKDAWEQDSASVKFPHHGRFRKTHWRLLDSSAAQGKATGPVAFKLKKSGEPSTAIFLDDDAFNDLLEKNLQHLRTFGRRILAGDMRVNPYRTKSGNQSACDYCPCAGVCRIDPWGDSFRILARPPRPNKKASNAAGA